MSCQRLNTFVVSELLKMADEVIEKERLREQVSADRKRFVAALDALP